MNTTFSFNRLGLLIKRYFVENRQRELSFWGIVIVVFMLMHQNVSVEIFFYIAGFIFAARMFKIFAYTPGGMHYLLIPATHLEKLVTTIFLSTFYYLIMLLITYSIGTLLGTELGNAIFGTQHDLSLSLFQMDSVNSTMNYSGIRQVNFLDFLLGFALTQSIFLLGSVYFKRNAVGKTFLTLISFAFVIGLIELVIFKVSFGSYHLNGQSLDVNFTSGDDVFAGFKLILKTIKYLLIPFFWIVTYFRLTEKQV
jgi:hypothetical protein